MKAEVETMNEYVLNGEMWDVIRGENKDPFGVLGIHKLEDMGKNPVFSIRTFMPNAKEVTVSDETFGGSYPMKKVHEDGFFVVEIDHKPDFFKYKFEVLDHEGNHFSAYDAYSFLPFLTEFDLHLFNQGNFHKVYDKFGAHVMEYNGIQGTLFAVWAPCARRVSVVGAFNQWDGRRCQMRSLGSSGVWEIFIPGVQSGDVYKYEIKTPDGELYHKADPYAFYAELRPNTASRVFDISRYQWKDEEWVSNRAHSNVFDKPVSIYELHLSSWKRVSEEDDAVYNYRELAGMLIPYIKDMGYTHIELLPIAEHPFDGSWGYQITGYYAITSRFGTPEDFMYFVDRCHQENIGVIVDWVPAHFPKDGHGLARFDGTALYEHADSRQGEHPDWGTHIFNYGRHEVRNFLVSNALFLFEKYHIDGLRVDAVASMLYLDYAKKDGEWIPNQYGGKENIEAIHFMRELNETVYQYHPGVMMIAEESTDWSLVTKPPYVGGLGFSFKWNMGWMNDFLEYISKDPIYRKYHHGSLTFSMIYAYAENFTLVLSHDEVVHGKGSMIGKMPGDYWQQFAGLRASYGFMYGHPGKKLLFMGCEFAQFIEWNYKKSLDWNLLDYDMHKKMQNYVRDLNHFYRNNKSLFEVDFDKEGFEWIDAWDSDHSIISFMRKAKDWKDALLFVCNFTPQVHQNYRMGAPFHTHYEEVFNSDDPKYGGSGVGNPQGIQANDTPYHDKPFSMDISVPPLAVVVFRPKL
jgi:1,4-alpha-glucan branching enzyme